MGTLERLAERLADPATRVVVTGQQPGLYGGPLLTLTKMAAAVRWAEAIAEAGAPAVAVFWVATEDHDWAEAAQATLLAADGPRRFDLGDDRSPLLPLGMRTFGPGLGAITQRLLRRTGSLDAVELDRDPGSPADAPASFNVLMLRHFVFWTLNCPEFGQ